jgi:flagellar motor protein MotB
MNAHSAAKELHSMMEPLLRNHPKFEVTETVCAGARVPLIKLRYGGIDVDLSCNNTEPLPNTQLLRAYAELHPVVKNLGILVKLWAKARGVSGAKQGHLSSYALTIMSIYFLQVETSVQLPCFPIWAFDGSASLPDCARQTKWSCQATLPVLLARFFTFFASEFVWGSEVVSIQLGRRTFCTDDSVHAQLRGRNLQRLHVADPFLQGRNLNCVLASQQEGVLYTAFTEAATALQAGFVPLGLQPTHAPPNDMTARVAERETPQFTGGAVQQEKPHQQPLQQKQQPQQQQQPYPAQPYQQPHQQHSHHPLRLQKPAHPDRPDFLLAGGSAASWPAPVPPSAPPAKATLHSQAGIGAKSTPARPQGGQSYYAEGTTQKSKGQEAANFKASDDVPWEEPTVNFKVSDRFLSEDQSTEAQSQGSSCTDNSPRSSSNTGQTFLTGAPGALAQVPPAGRPLNPAPAPNLGTQQHWRQQHHTMPGPAVMRAPTPAEVPFTKLILRL